MEDISNHLLYIGNGCLLLFYKVSNYFVDTIFFCGPEGCFTSNSIFPGYFVSVEYCGPYCYIWTTFVVGTWGGETYMALCTVPNMTLNIGLLKIFHNTRGF